MIKLLNLRFAPEYRDAELRGRAAAELGVSPDTLGKVRILKKSVDSRRKNDVHFVLTLGVETEHEEELLSRLGPGKAEAYRAPAHRFPRPAALPKKRPVVVGMGPAGLFAALCLAESGVPCTVLERGKPVEARAADVETFWRTGVLRPDSNVQFGEGGAGTFSDGKLNTGTHDDRISFVLETFARFGAPEDILYLAAPHIGTDKLRAVVKNLRLRLLALGCDVRFETKLEELEIRDGAVRAAAVSHGGKVERIETDTVILAPGNGARDTFRMLHAAGFPMSPKSFAVGVRIEHLQRDIDFAQYGAAATLGTLPASNYKLAVHTPEGRGVFTFCVCPGGAVVAAASEPGRLVTNGMSEYRRNGENCNGGLLVSVTPEDFGGALFGGMEFQERAEEEAFRAGGGGFLAPAQRVGDFLAGRPSVRLGKVRPTYRPGVTLCDLKTVLPDFISGPLAAALPEMDRKIRGFASPDAVMTAVETRSSSPVRINRDENRMSGVSGVFPAGEGAGYAGGIVSAAVDGIRCAESLCAYLEKKI